MVTIRTLEGVDPRLIQLLDAMVEAGEPIRVIESHRTAARQAWLYGQGRKGFDSDRHKAQWEADGSHDPHWRPGPIVTRVLRSAHMTGHALDIAILSGEEVTWKRDPYRDLVTRYGALAVQLNLENLGRSGDWLHWQVIARARR